MQKTYEALINKLDAATKGAAYPRAYKRGDRLYQVESRYFNNYSFCYVNLRVLEIISIRKHRLQVAKLPRMSGPGVEYHRTVDREDMERQGVTENHTVAYDGLHAESVYADPLEAVSDFLDGHNSRKNVRLSPELKQVVRDELIRRHLPKIAPTLADDEDEEDQGGQSDWWEIGE